MVWGFHQLRGSAVQFLSGHTSPEVETLTFSRGSSSHSGWEEREEKASNLLLGKERSGGNNTEKSDQLVWLVNFVERSDESPASHSREKFTQPLLVTPQLFILNHPDALENADQNAHSY